MQVQNSPTLNQVNKQKLLQTVSKYVGLLSESKQYEFSQKIQLLAHRKQQSKKPQQAQQLLFLAIEKLHSQIQSIKPQGYELFDSLIKLYQSHVQIYSIQKGQRIFNLLNIRRNNPTKYQYYYKFLKALKNKPMPQELIKDLVQFYVAKEQFTKAQSHVIELDIDNIKAFTKKWCEKVHKDEAIAIQCRLALLRGLFSDIDDCDQLLQGVDETSPFYKFSKFLISSSKLKSRDAYNLIGSRYQSFLQNDQIFHKIYLGYGSNYFKINNSKGNGLLSLFK